MRQDVSTYSMRRDVSTYSQLLKNFLEKNVFLRKVSYNHNISVLRYINESYFLNNLFYVTNSHWNKLL